MNVRAKFSLVSVKTTQFRCSGNAFDDDPSRTYTSGKTLQFTAVCDDGTPENQRFAKASPSGTLEIAVDNEEALKQFEVGKSYYLDFTLADK